MIFRLVLMTSLLTLAACGEKTAQETVESEQPDMAAPAAVAAAEPAALARTMSAAGAEVFFITPADGATVSSPVSIEFGIAGMEVVKAGVMQANSGHHHLLIDTELPDLGAPIPADEHHIHFGDGSTSAQISLPPGEHSLQMLLGDHLHIPHDPPLISTQITITVE